MSPERDAILLAGVVGLVVGWLVCLITREGAPLAHVSGAILGAFMGTRLYVAVDATPVDGFASLQTASATAGAIALALLVNQILRNG
jgi:uncharacterized membrane protein YeaQ/YmgE (transglycosylase-associated protein family)